MMAKYKFPAVRGAGERGGIDGTQRMFRAGKLFCILLIVVDICPYKIPQTHRTYKTKSEPSYKLESWDDNLSVRFTSCNKYTTLMDDVNKGRDCVWGVISLPFSQFSCEPKTS